MKIPGRVRSEGRQWWPELLWAALAAPILIWDHHGGVFLVTFCTVVLGIGWAMGQRHRKLPMQATLEGVRQDVGEIRETMHAAVEAFAEPAPASPQTRLRLHKGGMA
jgi:hypothetical protein